VYNINMNQLTASKRINIVLPMEIISFVDNVAKKGERSRFFGEAVRFYAKEKSKANLIKALRDGAIKRSGRDISLAREWFPVEHNNLSKQD